MSTVGTVLKLALAREDAFGKVLAGSTGRGIRTLVKEAKAAKLAGEGGILKNFAKLADLEVDKFESLTKTIDKYNLDKKTLSALKKSSKNMKNFTKNIQRVIDGEDAATVFSKASTESVEELTKKMAKGGADDVLENLGETAAKKGIFSRLGADIAKKFPKLAEFGSKFKGKGGSIAIALSLVFEVPAIIQAFKNGDGLQQIGRSAINMGGMAAGAALGSAIGTFIPIPIVGTTVGAIVGGALGFIGSMICGDVAKKAGDAIFGKSIQDQKDEAAAAAEEAGYDPQTVATEAQPVASTSDTITGRTSSIGDISTTEPPKYLYGFKPVLDVKA